MREHPLHAAVRHIRGLAAIPSDGETSDQELLRRFTSRHDETAFAALMRRHEPMVRGVARRLLGQESNVDDVFQTVFLVLACKAHSVRKHRSLAGWLYGIAWRTALRARRDAARRKDREGRAVAREPSDTARDSAWRELCAVLDTELYRLPESERSALVLCYLQGRTRDEAAHQLDLSVRTLDRRLQCGRERLRLQLARRGITLSAALLALGLTRGIAGATTTAKLGTITARAAANILSGRQAVAPEVSREVVALMKGVLQNMLQTRIKFVAVSFLALTLLGTAAGVLAFRAAAQDTATPGQQPSPPAAVRTDDPKSAEPAPVPYAILLIEDAEPRLLPDARQAIVPRESNPSAYRQRQAFLLPSRSTIRAALRRDEVKRLEMLKGKTNLASWLERHIKAVLLENTGLLHVYFVGEGSLEERVILINALVSSYMDEFVYEEKRAKETRLVEMEKVLEISEGRLKEKRAKLLQMSRIRPGTSSSLQRQLAREDLSQFRKELMRVSLAKVAAEARLQHRKREAGEGVGKAAFAELNEEIAVLAAQEKLLEARTQKMISSLAKQEDLITDAEADERERLRSLREEIAAEEEFNKDLARRVRSYQVELRAAPRVRILQRAEAGPKEK